ncbi:titin homolog [Diaphorina citri]|uniref:Titin homolog n=1 Tax=Diaphorina citri TaxID=121845 RepID=A0A3Q0IU00_DIACI|nr:titin homolog [Diaphorina citri]
MHEFSKDVMARKRIIQEVNGTSGDLGGDTSKTAVGDVEKAFYTNESALLDSKPKFSQRLFDKSGTQGTTLCLSCSILYTKDSVKYAPYYAPELIEWYKDGQNILTFSDVRRYRAFFCDNIATLEIKDCKLDDSGQYTCLARNKYGRSSTSCNVKVYANFEPAPMGPVFSRLIKENYKFLDDELTLECRVKCFPPAKITWLKDNVPIRPINSYSFLFVGYVKPEVIWLRGNTPLPKSSPRFKYIEDSNNLHTLILSGVTAEEAGKYTCRVSNEYGYTETFARVDVINVSSGAVKHEKPAMFLTRPDTMMSVALGEDISFSFRLAGSPKPKVTWMKGIKDITTSSRTMTETVNDYVRLTLKRATDDENGTYFIVARNIYGSDRAFVTVRVSRYLHIEYPAL